jgi:tetratricopeptide (TPR) repeat protein
VIATFRRTEGVTDANIHGEIQRAIQDKLAELGVENVRVEIEPTAVEARDRETAEVLGQQYDASMIVWGADTGARLEVNFLNLKEPDFDAAEATLNETARTQLARPDAFAQFVIEDLPNHFTFLTLFAVGQSFVTQSDFATATTLIEEAVNLLPDFATIPDDFDLDAAYFRLGWLYQVTEQDHQAIANYAQAIALNPQDAEAFNNRGIVYYDLGEREKAINDFEQAIALNPQYGEAFYNRGIVYYGLGEDEKAIAGFAQAIVLNPQDAEAFYNRGIVYYGLGQNEAAIADFDQAIIFNLQDAKVFNNRGLAYYNLDEYEAAIADFDQAITLDPDYAASYLNRALAHLALVQNAEALVDLRQYLELDPQSEQREAVEETIAQLEAQLEN